MSPDQRAQATENVWRSIEQEFGLLSSSDVAGRVGKSGRSYAHDRRKAGKLLAVKRGARYFYPGFQLDASGPVPIIKSLADQAKRLGVREEITMLWGHAVPDTQRDVPSPRSQPGSAGQGRQEARHRLLGDARRPAGSPLRRVAAGD